MKTFQLLTFVLLFSLCSFQLLAQTAINIEGTWKEYWGAPGELSYNDTFVVKKRDSSYSISCTNRDNYEFSKIIFDGEIFSFEILNTIGNDKLPYRLQVTDDQLLSGIAISITGEKTSIKWERIKPEIIEQ